MNWEMLDGVELIDVQLAQTLLENKGTEAHAALIAAMMYSMRQGHLCLDLAELGEGMQQAASTLPSHLPIIRLDNLLYFQKNWVFETRFFEQIKRLSAFSAEPIPHEPSDLNPEQAEAVRSSLHSGFSLITGGPGTGKSYTAARIASACLKQGLKIEVAAPTGKAAARLEEGLSRIGLPKDSFRCRTLHALLGIRNASDLNREGTWIPADLLLVDECSMIDARLFAYLLASIQQGTRVILMGDPDQLPPVESGSFFADLVAIAPTLGIPSTHLKTCMRSDRLDILTLAQAMKEGKEVKPHLDLGLEASRPEVFYEKLWEYVQNRFAEGGDFQILCCIRKGPYGVDAINQFLSERLRAPSAPILITRTDAKLGVYNGDTGTLYPDRATLSSGLTLPAVALPAYEYAYCLSVHKSQGSEYKDVLLIIPSGSETFGREVLYTAVTRARETIAIAAHPDALARALHTTTRRRSGLISRGRQHQEQQRPLAG
jgi:exodeoxyribonuclease V alpha subunit